MPKFRFKSARKNKINFITDKQEMLNTQIIKGSHIEIFSNKTLILEECYGMVDYRENYIKLKLKKGFINLLGTNFLISEFDNNRIVINGNISSLEFCV